MATQVLEDVRPGGMQAVNTDALTLPAKHSITLTVNGSVKRLDIMPWTTLLDLLRESLDLTGTKKGCDHGQCGACTVLVNGKRINACLSLAIMRDGAEVTTIEGLAQGDELHPLQAAFVEHDAFQCGYCTPGQICSAVGLINEGRAKTGHDIRELMSGNICRCGAYPNIVTAIEKVMQIGEGVNEYETFRLHPRRRYRRDAERFGWRNGPLQPRSMQDGHTLTGWGMATGQWDAMQGPAKATALLSADGKLTVGSGTADIGTGTYTIMTQIAAETLGLPLEDVTFTLGDSLLPEAPIEGGLWTASSVGTAVQAVCEQIGQRVYRLAQKVEHSPLAGFGHDDIEFADGYVRRKSNPTQQVAIVDAMKHGGVDSIEETAATQPSMLKQARYSRTSHSAVFAEVKVDEELGIVRVTRIVSAIAGGRVLNPKTARSQIMGGIVWGISMALHEDAYIDHNLGRFMNHNLAEYHVPVNADIHDIEVIFVPEDDDVVNPLGVKGLGEIGLVGVAAAINNAIYYATGKRVRDLPLTPDKLL